VAEICGTVRAYARHIKRGEPTCQACRDARSAYQRAHSVSQGRAQTRLSREFRDRYHEILNEERAAVGLPPVHVAGDR
jgi:Zn-finger domain-containing protein